MHIQICIKKNVEKYQPKYSDHLSWQEPWSQPLTPHVHPAYKICKKWKPKTLLS